MSCLLLFLSILLSMVDFSNRSLNYVAIQKQDGTIFIYNLSSNTMDSVGSIDIQDEMVNLRLVSDSVFIQSAMGKQIFFKIDSSVIDTINHSDYTVLANGIDVKLFYNDKLLWGKSHRNKGYYSSREGYRNASVSAKRRKVLAERNYLGALGFFTSKRYKPNVVEIDFDTKKEEVVCKKCNNPSYSINESFILCHRNKKQEYLIIDTQTKHIRVINCKTALWIK